jgi:hypothetical protein
MTDCENKYSVYARGANCYCTAFMGCFHRHFQIKPEIKASGGLILNLDKGVHDSDYYLEVSVTNIHTNLFSYNCCKFGNIGNGYF